MFGSQGRCLKLHNCKDTAPATCFNTLWLPETWRDMMRAEVVRGRLLLSLSLSSIGLPARGSCPRGCTEKRGACMTHRVGVEDGMVGEIHIHTFALLRSAQKLFCEHWIPVCLVQFRENVCTDAKNNDSGVVSWIFCVLLFIPVPTLLLTLPPRHPRRMEIDRNGWATCCHYP